MFIKVTQILVGKNNIKRAALIPKADISGAYCLMDALDIDVEAIAAGAKTRIHDRSGGVWFVADYFTVVESMLAS